MPIIQVFLFTVKRSKKNHFGVNSSHPELGEQQCKLLRVLTNRDLAGDKLTWWYRERCGEGEEMHAIMKNDLAGEHLPSAHFGANAT